MVERKSISLSPKHSRKVERIAEKFGLSTFSAALSVMIELYPEGTPADSNKLPAPERTRRIPVWKKDKVARLE